MPVKDFYSVRPNELEPGDVLVCTVTLHVSYRKDENGLPMYRMYRCGYPPQIGEESIPQGSNIGVNVEKVMQSLFPVVRDAGLQPD